MARSPLDLIDRRVFPDKCHPKVEPSIQSAVPATAPQQALAMATPLRVARAHGLRGSRARAIAGGSLPPPRRRGGLRGSRRRAAARRRRDEEPRRAHQDHGAAGRPAATTRAVRAPSKAIAIAKDPSKRAVHSARSRLSAGSSATNTSRSPRSTTVPGSGTTSRCSAPDPCGRRTTRIWAP